MSTSFYLADKSVPKGKKAARKTTRAGGSGEDLTKIAQEQQVKLEKEREEIKEKIKVAKEAAAAAKEAADSGDKTGSSQPSTDGETKAAKPSGPGKNANHRAYGTV